MEGEGQEVAEGPGLLDESGVFLGGAFLSGGFQGGAFQGGEADEGVR